MKIDLKELELALNWIKANSNDVNIHIDIENSVSVLRVGTPNQEIVKITLFDSDTHIKAKISKEDYLECSVNK